jgi:hypothetical protein
MENVKWVLLAVCLASVIWPLLAKPTASNKEDSEIEQKDQ